MATTKQQIAEAAAGADESTADLVCFYQPQSGLHYSASMNKAPIRCSFDDLPEREFDDGYGGVEGEPVLCFGPRFVYVKVCYDGSEWIAAVPRHPECVGDSLPIFGGG